MQEQKFNPATTIPTIPFRLPEEDAFLYTTNYSSWIKVFFTRSNKKEHLTSFFILKRDFSYA